VVDVEIDDCHALGAILALRFARHNGDVVDEAKAHRPVVLGVMPRRTHSTEGVADAAERDFLKRQQPGPERCRCRIERSGGNECVLVDPRDPFGGTSTGKILQVVPRMHELCKSEIARRRIETLQTGEFLAVEGLVDRPDAIGSLRVAGRGDMAFEIALRDEQCGHEGPPDYP